MARASKKNERTPASATHATGGKPRIDIGETMREGADPARARAPVQVAEQRSTAPSRTGKRGVVGYVAPELWAQPQHLAIDERSSIQALVLEGIERVLEAPGITPKTND